ncbi:unnamed protein product [Spodoptera littoralis]|uniref:Uncharacterized protein n=1 Tax=Spodoptera littoralis TaxID=7109 RepID=A0A9P0NA86_SPOLI|nr:unnamed protein product [Spodoptera littoralis]CAH1647157.1 unnamed protein product [Spodoptera littoralis]
MKISVLITTILIVQVSSTSFFDLFHGAVQSVQNGFGKLLTDVVTDVKETVDCTILAVQQMLSLSEDATRRYYEKCGNGMNSTSTDGNTTSVEGIQPGNEENLEKEIDEKINKTMSKVLDDYKPDEKIKELEKLLVIESEQLADVNELLKKEIKKLSEEVGKDFKNIKHNDTESSVETILHEIKVLENKELNTRNTSEIKEIHHVMSEVVDKIDAIEATEATENVKLDEIVGDLQNKSKDNSIALLKQEIKEWEEEESRNLGELKKEVQEHVKIIDRPKIEPECNHTQPVIFNMDISKGSTARSINSRELSSDNITQARVINDGDSNYQSLNVSKSSNETTELVELTKHVNPDTEPLTTASPTMNQNENKSIETIKIDNVYVSTESMSNKSSDYMVNNDTVIVRGIQNTNVDLTSTTQGITISGDTNNTETDSSINMGTTSTEKIHPLGETLPSNETVTPAKIESIVMKPPKNNFTDTHLTSIPLFRYDGYISANKPIQPEELTTVRNEEITTVTAIPIDTITPDLPITDSMPASETIPPQLLTTPENTDNTTVTTEPNEKVTSNLSITYNSPANEDNPTVTTEPYNSLPPNTSDTDSAHVSESSIPAKPTTLDNEDNPTIITESNDTVTTNLPVIPASENIPLLELTTVDNEDSPTITTEPDDKVTILLPITDRLPVSETIPAEEFTTASNGDNPTVSTEANESVIPNQSMIESAPANNENIPLEELTTVDDGDSSTFTTDTNDAVPPTLSMTDSSPASENIPLEEITTAVNDDNPTITTELNDTVTPDMSTTDSTSASETIPSEVASVIPNDEESIPTTTSVNDYTVLTQNSTYITNTSEEGITPCCKDFEETLKRSVNENTTSSMVVENSPPTDTPELAIVTTIETAGTTLTTQIPTLRAGPVDNKNASFDYDAFFPSQTNKEVRQRAIKEARQLMKGRKRSERIINNILKNKRKGTVGLFSGPVPINSGK